MTSVQLDILAQRTRLMYHLLDLPRMHSICNANLFPGWHKGGARGVVGPEAKVREGHTLYKNL